MEKKNKDCLNTIRLLAAFEVLYFHTLAHLSIEMPQILNSIVSFFYGVPVFFAMSGYLIWMSVGRSNSFIDYCKKRFWRIFPELWGAVLVEILVLLLLYDHVIEWGKLVLFTLTQGTIFQFWMPDFLSDYGCGCPNASLWTICVLIQFYFVAYFAYRQLHGRSIFYWSCIILLFIIVGYFTNTIQDSLPEIYAKLYGKTLFPYFWLFLIAAFISEFKDRILHYINRYWWISLCIVIIIMNTNEDLALYNYGLFRSVFLFVGLLGFAYNCPQLNVKVDISYAVYIYHMTNVNALIALGLTGDSYLLFVVIVLTFVVSYLSTITVGKYCIQRKAHAREKTDRLFK